jgi:hypothetical protein
VDGQCVVLWADTTLVTLVVLSPTRTDFSAGRRSG